MGTAGRRQIILRHLLPLSLLSLAALTGIWRIAQSPPEAVFQPPPSVRDNPLKLAAQSAFISLEPGPHRHAPSLIELKNGSLRAFWFSGSREGAPDVEIRSATFDPLTARWSPETSIVNREQTQSGLWRFVKKIGNAVAVRDGQDRLQLFYVTVSLGGWAGSSITRIVSSDEGMSWGPPQRLITSPFLNISTLVKGAPFHFSDHTIGLPVYHEFLGKFGEILRLDDQGKLLDKQRLSYGKTTLQPVLLVRDARHAQALMRHSGAGPNRVMQVATTDGGQHWSAPQPLSLANPNAAVSAITLPDGTLLAALNDSESDRDVLSLVFSRDGGTHWDTFEILEDQSKLRGPSLNPAAYQEASAKLGRLADPLLASAYDGKLKDFAAATSQHMCRENRQCAFEFSYPYLTLTTNGDVHLVYTWNRSYIRHRMFPREQLTQLLREKTDARTR
ncbi:MAG: sialidase family protein [Betaproteobacteria bacterium]